MKKIILLHLAIAMISSYTLQAQVSITTDESPPDPSAMLEVKSSSKGFLPPRMTATERDAISSPANGLLVFVTDDNKLYYWDGAIWTQVIDECQPTGPAGGDLTGTYPNPTVKKFKIILYHQRYQSQDKC